MPPTTVSRAAVSVCPPLRSPKAPPLGFPQRRHLGLATPQSHTPLPELRLLGQSLSEPHLLASARHVSWLWLRPEPPPCRSHAFWVAPGPLCICCLYLATLLGHAPETPLARARLLGLLSAFHPGPSHASRPLLTQATPRFASLSASPLLKSGLLSLQSLPPAGLPAGRPSSRASASSLEKESSAPLQVSESRTGLASRATSAPSGERGPHRHRKRKRRTAGPWRRCLTSQTWCSWRSSHTSRSGTGSASPGAALLLGGKSRAGAQQEMRIRSQ